MVPEYVIVTLQSVSGVFWGDYQLPSGTPVEKLLPLLNQALRMRLGTGTTPVLYYGGYPLAQDKTLADHGIWDGTILTVKEEME